MKTIILLLCLVSSSVWAGEWFKTTSLSFGIGDEIYRCTVTENTRCRGYDIGPNPIGKYKISQSIYTSQKFQFSFEKLHLSSLNESYRESPIDYYGFELTLKHDWY